MCLKLEPLDAGAASGITFTAPRWETSPPEPVTKHKPRQPDHPSAGFYYPGLKDLPAIAKVEFTRVLALLCFLTLAYWYDIEFYNTEWGQSKFESLQ